MQPEDFIGLVVLVGSVALTIFGVIWLPILRRRELREIEEARKQPISTEISGSILLDADHNERATPIQGLNLNSAIELKRIVEENAEAVAVVMDDGAVLGVLPAEIGSDLAPEIAARNQINAKIKSLSGGNKADPEYRMTLELTRPSE